MKAPVRLTVAVFVAGIAVAASHVLPSFLMRTAVADAQTVQVDGPHVIRLYCAGCHTAGRAAVDLDGPTDLQALRHDPLTWEDALRMIRSGRMPPQRFPQPSTSERTQAIRWLETEIANAKSYANASLRVRRLNRQEYLNTIRDRLGVSAVSMTELPDDDRGWDTLDAIPELTNDQKVAYNAAAERAVNAARIAELLPVYVPGYLEAIALLIEVDERAPKIDGQIASAFLASFAQQAYRRPVSREEVDGMSDAFNTSISAGRGFEKSLKIVMRSILASPAFLFCIEDNRPGKTITEFELASRLSFFLWSSGPDRELLSLAEHALLRRNLEAQTQRMLKDARSQELARTFTQRWLGFDKAAFPGLDDALRNDMLQETERFVISIIEEDRPVTDLVQGNYTFVNERLARHYGIEGVEGAKFQRVVNPQRGGLLTQGSVLALTSPGGSSSPVQRGKWVLDKILGTPPQPPPPGLLAAFEKTRKSFPAGSVRQLMAQHREQKSCADCHGQMDGIGLAMENFDGLGAWRTHYDTGPVEASVMPDGTVLNGPSDLKNYLMRRRTQITQGLGNRLLAHALGHKPRLGNSFNTSNPDPSFSTLILDVVRCESFHSVRPN